MDRSLSSGLLRFVGALLVVAIVAALALVAWRTYTERYRVTTGPNDDVAVTQVVRATFSGASDLKVADLSGTVQATASSARLSGMLNATRVVKAPFSVEYFVDLSRMGPADFLWDPQTRTLTVRPPDVRVGPANVDEARTYLDQTQGVFVTRGQMAEMQRQAAGRAQGAAYKAAIQPERIAQARDNARADLARLVGGPLKAAGLGNVRVRVLFPGEGARSAEHWDVSRSIPEVLADPAPAR